ncbi:MAG: YgfZ/GcvT domain-containing protein [Vicinamibacteraceae bacterium]
MVPGYLLPPLIAYQAAKRGAAVRDRSAEGRLGVFGADRADWLQGLVTNDVKALVPGQGCYAAYLTPQGRMLSDLRLLALDDAFLIDVPGNALALVVERFERFIITEDVHLSDRTSELGRLAVYGPEAAGRLAGCLDIRGERLASLSEHQHISVGWSGVDVLVAGSRDLGSVAFDVYVPRAHLSRLEEELGGAGVVRLDEATWHTLRVEAGQPSFGVDMTDDTIPLEAGIEDRAISLTKGCYVGQEVIIRVLHRGQGRVARKLVRLVQVAASPPSDADHAASAKKGDWSAPAFVRDATIASGEREVGRITSAAWSPDLGRSIGLGYVRRDLAEPGTRLEVLSDGERVEVSVES